MTRKPTTAIRNEPVGMYLSEMEYALLSADAEATGEKMTVVVRSCWRENREKFLRHLLGPWQDGGPRKVKVSIYLTLPEYESIVSDSEIIHIPVTVMLRAAWTENREKFLRSRGIAIE